MKLYCLCIYILTLFIVSGCARAPQDEHAAFLLNSVLDKDAYTENDATRQPELIVKVRRLSRQLLQQPFFVQGSFKAGQDLIILIADIDPGIAAQIRQQVSRLELQRNSAEVLGQSGWFNIHNSATSRAEHAPESDDAAPNGKGYMLVTTLKPLTAHTAQLSLALVNRQFATIEAQVHCSVAINSTIKLHRDIKLQSSMQNYADPR